MKRFTALGLLFFALHISALAQSGWFWQNPLPQGHSLRSIDFADNNTGWAVGTNGTILKTTNGGTHWTLQTSGTTTELRSVDFADNSTGWAVGEVGTILRTTNSGTNWTPQSSGITNWLWEVEFADNSIGWGK
jgi:photosystem II stability/assembly factor-like uncharacterized protein